MRACALANAIRRLYTSRDQTERYKPVHSSDQSEPPATPKTQAAVGGAGGTGDGLVAADGEDLQFDPEADGDLARQSTIYMPPAPLTRTLTMSDSAGSGGAQPEKPSCVPNRLARAGGCRRTPHEPKVGAERAHT